MVVPCLGCLKTILQAGGSLQPPIPFARVHHAELSHQHIISVLTPLLPHLEDLQSLAGIHHTQLGYLRLLLLPPYNLLGILFLSFLPLIFVPLKVLLIYITCDGTVSRFPKLFVGQVPALLPHHK